MKQRYRSASQSSARLSNSKLFNWSKSAWNKNLSDLGGLLGKYVAEYDKRKRNGVAIFEIWKAVKHCAILHEKVINLKPEKDISAYKKARNAEFEYCLKDVKDIVKGAVGFIKEFNADHQNDAEVTVTPAKIAQLQKDRDKGAGIASGLNHALKVWQENLCKEIHGNQFDEKQAEFNKEIDDQLLEEKQKMLADKVAQVTATHTTGDTSILFALKSALLENSSVLKIEYLIQVAEDIDAVRHIPNIKKLADVAKRILLGPRRQMTSAEFMELFNERTNDGFEFFGPLGITMLEDFSMFDFTGCFDTRKYYFNPPEFGKSLTGKLSKFSQLTVSGETKRNLRIQESAAYYCYVYPMHKKPLTCTSKNDSLRYKEPYNLVLNFGGYAYFDSNRNLVQLNAVYNMGDNVYFGRKMHFKNPSDVVATLQSENRLHNVTMAEVLSHGVDKFGWLVPGEYGNANHGAFMFTFIDRDTPPCYFELVPHKVGKTNESINAQKDDRMVGYFLLDDTLNM